MHFSNVQAQNLKTPATFLLIMLLAITLGACGGDDKDPEPTSTVVSTPTSTAPVPTTTPEVPSTIELTDANAQLVTDGLCQVLVPDGWVDDGTGRGTTSGGHRFVLFGGRLTSATSWAAAINVVATPTAGRIIASVEQTDDSILATFADDRGFAYRERFDSVYCDLTITASRPVSPEERAYWTAVIASIQAVPAPQ